MSSTRKNNINSYERKARAEITKEVEAEVAGDIAHVHERFDKGITRYRKRLDECKASLKPSKTRKNSSSFTNRLSSFRSNVSKCQAMIKKIASLEQERLGQLKELEEWKAYTIDKRLKQELRELHSTLKMRNFAKSLHRQL